MDEDDFVCVGGLAEEEGLGLGGLVCAWMLVGCLEVDLGLGWVLGVGCCSWGSE